MRYLLLFSAFSILLMNSCVGNKNKKLIGTWLATSVVQNDRTLEVELSEINFQFKNDGTYQFESTLDYKEAGTFTLEGNKLYTLDTVNQTSQGKIVLVEQINSDTLQLKMQKEEETMLVTLVKE